MATGAPFKQSDVNKFSSQYESSQEDTALQARGEFIKFFPSKKLSELTVADYVVGHQTASFCNFVESRTKAWANIQGATSKKFGIYFGRTKSDEHKRYRFTEKFGQTADDAFSNVKAAVLQLADLGSKSTPNFREIDGNPLSQMFKAKILSLYYPNRFVAICSSENLEMLGDIFDYEPDLPCSQYQFLLRGLKDQDAVTRSWSNPKFMAFLYKVYVKGDFFRTDTLEKPTQRKHRKVDFEDIQRQRSEIGKAAEAFALQWEKERLLGAGLEHLVSKIRDLRDYPGHGYDFLSHSTQLEPRHIEVKSVAAIGESFRFFLSDNEEKTSKSKGYGSRYYFYLVFFDSKGKPQELRALLADKLYQKAELRPASYSVLFDWGAATAEK